METTVLESEESIDAIFPDIICDFIKEKNIFPVASPTAVIFGSQPGAGKSELERIARDKAKNNIVVCNADKLRNYHPQTEEIIEKDAAAYYQRTEAFALKLREKLVAYCLQHKYNFILETTFSWKEGMNDTIREFKSHNFKVDILLLAVDKAVSRIGSLLLYEKERERGKFYSRMMPKEEHDDYFNAILPTVVAVEKEKLYDNLTIYANAFSMDEPIVQLTNRNDTL